MESNLNILAGLHWYRHRYNLHDEWSAAHTQLVVQFLMGIELSDLDASWITEQINCGGSITCCN